jgi:cystathionine beta-lyase/cystathionine gamma-synthase
MTHAPVCAEAQLTAGITRNLIRLSIGLESAQDLIEDLLGALHAVERQIADVSLRAVSA